MRALVGLLTLAALAACADRAPVAPGADTGDPAGNGQLLQSVDCRVDAVAGTFACGDGEPVGLSPEVTVGGQGTYVQLSSSSVSTASGVLSADVTVGNMLAQPMTDVRIFFHSGPTNGVAVRNADGTGTFTATGQPYHEYSGTTRLLGGDGVLKAGEMSSVKTWEFTLNGAATFTFSVYVTATLPAESAILRWESMSSGTSEILTAVWGTSASDIYVTAWADTILHYDGVSWSVIDPPGSYVYGAVWGSGPNDVFAGGTGVVHYDGSVWTDMNVTNTIHALWGTSSTDVYGVGNDGLVLNYDGATWSPVSMAADYDDVTEDFRGIWGTSSDDIFIVSLLGHVYHWDGAHWQATSVLPGVSPRPDLFGVWGRSSSEVYAVGSGYTLLRYNGVDWSQISTTGNGALLSVWGATELYMVGEGGTGTPTAALYDGTDVTTLTAFDPSPLYGVWGTSNTDVYAVGADGLILHGTR